MLKIKKRYFWPNSIKNQLIMGVALVHTFLMTFFIYDLISKEKNFLLDQTKQQTIALATTIASNTAEWMLSRNVVGIQEIVESQSSYPNLSYAMVFDNNGLILAHSEPTIVGKYLKDIQASKKYSYSDFHVKQSNDLIDVTAKIAVNQQIIGWARVGINTESVQNNLKYLTLEGFFYTLFAIIAGSFIAWVLGNSLTRRIREVINATNKIDPDKQLTTFENIESDEIGELMTNFNQMEAKIHQQFLDNQSYLKQIEVMAYSDTLTGLKSRILLESELDNALNRAKRNHHYSALLFVDVDKFKQLNDSYGHEKGDLLLKTMTKRILHRLKSDGIAFRFGGDEFILLFEDIGFSLYSASLQARKIANQLQKSLNEPYQLNDIMYKTTVSIGIDLFNEQTKLNAAEIVRRADIALYASKAAGRNLTTLFESEMEEKVKNDLLLEEGLEHAVERNEFFWMIQPQIDMKNNKVVGGEVLMRWNYRGDFIAPGKFIALAEDNLTIIPISNWLFESVFTYMKQHRLNKELTLSINLSPKHFFETNLVKKMEQLLNKYKIPPEQIKLEITEGLLLDNLETAIDILKQLKRIGLKISLDDFGTGFSSLSYLKNLPIDQLKIDKSFIDDLPHNDKTSAVTKTIIDLTKNLNIHVIAEGVEYQNQIDFLIENHCYECQGFYYSKPLNPNEFITFSQHF